MDTLTFRTQNRLMNALSAGEYHHTPPKRAEQTRLSPAELREILADQERWVSDAIAEFITGIPASTLRRFRFEGRARGTSSAANGVVTKSRGCWSTWSGAPWKRQTHARTRARKPASEQSKGREELTCT